jgi:hypothetical protein
MNELKTMYNYEKIETIKDMASERDFLHEAAWQKQMYSIR